MSDITDSIVLQIGQGSPSAFLGCFGPRQIDHVNHPNPSESKARNPEGREGLQVIRIQRSHMFIDLHT